MSTQSSAQAGTVDASAAGNVGGAGEGGEGGCAAEQLVGGGSGSTVTAGSHFGSKGGAGLDGDAEEGREEGFGGSGDGVLGARASGSVGGGGSSRGFGDEADLDGGQNQDRSTHESGNHNRDASPQAANSSSRNTRCKGRAGLTAGSSSMKSRAHSPDEASAARVGVLEQNVARLTEQLKAAKAKA